MGMKEVNGRWTWVLTNETFTGQWAKGQGPDAGKDHQDCGVIYKTNNIFADVSWYTERYGICMVGQCLD